MWGDDFTQPNYKIASQTMRVIQDSLTLDGLSNLYQMKYSTISDYFDSVFEDQKRTKVEWPVEHGDFWGYNGNSNAIWTGFYSTNPEIKREITAFSDFTQGAT